MRSVLFLSILLLKIIASPAQLLYGVVVDSASLEPIAYASVVTADRKNGTYTNELGEFGISVSTFPVKLIVGHVAFKEKSITIAEKKGNIKIEISPLVQVLPEVRISNLSPQQIVLEAWKRNKSFSDHEYQAKAFYRQVNKTDSLYTEVHEVFYNLIFTNQGITKWKLDQGRFAKQKFFPYSKKEKIAAIRNFSSLSKVMKTYYTGGRGPMFPVNGHVASLFDVELKGVLQNGSETYLSFYCKAKNSLRNYPVFEGTVVVRERDYAIMSFEGVMNNPYGIDKTMGKVAETKNHRWTALITYEHDSVFFQSRLQHVKVTNSFDYFNKEFKTWHNLTTTSNLYLYEFLEKVSDEDFLGNNQKNLTQKDIDMISALDYDPRFWRDNQIVKRTPMEEEVIIAFEKAGSFEGKLFKEDN